MRAELIITSLSRRNSYSTFATPHANCCTEKRALKGALLLLAPRRGVFRGKRFSSSFQHESDRKREGRDRRPHYTLRARRSKKKVFCSGIPRISFVLPERDLYFSLYSGVLNLKTGEEGRRDAPCKKFLYYYKFQTLAAAAPALILFLPLCCQEGIKIETPRANFSPSSFFGSF